VLSHIIDNGTTNIRTRNFYEKLGCIYMSYSTVSQEVREMMAIVSGNE